jgi:hypothetical protein
MAMDVYAEIVEKIVEHQQSIIGPVAIQQAEQVKGISIDPATHKVTLNGDQNAIIDNLVRNYQDLFGQIAVEVCKEAAAKVVVQLQPGQLPASLR